MENINKYNINEQIKLPSNKPISIEFPDCVKSLNYNLIRTSTNQYYYNIKGLYFFNNYRVFDPKRKIMGTYSCNQLNESKLLNEQIEVSDEEFDKIYNKFVDFIEGDVLKNVDEELSSAYNELKKLYGKTYNGKNAINQIISFYKQFENDNLIKYINTIQPNSPLGIATKQKILNTFVLSKRNTTQPTQNNNNKINDLIKSIKWDTKKSSELNTTGISSNKQIVNKLKYHNCNDFPFKYGCISSEIKNIQQVLSIEPTKGYFGPKTKQVLLSLGYELDNGITKEMYDYIINQNRNLGNVSSFDNEIKDKENFIKTNIQNPSDKFDISENIKKIIKKNLLDLYNSKYL